jgi:carboxylesterase type B
VRAYLFTHTPASTPPDYGAFHSAEIPYVFDTLPPNSPPLDVAIARNVSALWAAFASGALTEGEWPEFSGGGGVYRTFTDEGEGVMLDAEERAARSCGAWDYFTGGGGGDREGAEKLKEAYKDAVKSLRALLEEGVSGALGC